MKVFLIGLPGVGKSYWGKRIAERLELMLIDLDQSIEDKEKKIIKDIFEASGEAYFRQIERNTLHNESLSLEDILVACGGGTPCFHDNIDFMKENGTVIYLRSSPKHIASNLNSKQEELNARPLYKNNPQSTLKQTEELLNKRKEYYEKADHIIDVDRPDDLIFEDIDKIFSTKN